MTEPKPKPRTERGRYTLTLEDAGTINAPLAVRLRTALKRLSRGHGLRTVRIEPEPKETTP